MTQTDAPTEVIEWPALTEANTVAEIKDHLTTMHGSWVQWQVNTNRGGFSKARKEQLLALHDRLHDGSEHSRNLISSYGFVTPHEHTDIEIGEQTSATPGSTPRLTPAERKTLENLVDYDFRSLQQEIGQMAADTLADRLSSLDAEFREQTKLAERFSRKLLDGRRRHAEVEQALIQEANDAGLSYATASSNGSQFTVTDRNLRVGAITQETEDDKQRALRTLERKRLGVQRTVLLTGLGVNAEQVLDAIPSASQLMLDAAREQAERKTAIAELTS